MRGFNRVILLGRLARDPEIRATTSQQKVSSFSLAIERSWKDKGNGETKKETIFVPCVAWGSLADISERFLQKGHVTLVDGRLQIREFNDKKTGEKRRATEVIVENITLLPNGKREDNQQSQQRLPRESSYGRQNENLPGGYGQDQEFEEDWPLDFSEIDNSEAADTPF